MARQYSKRTRSSVPLVNTVLARPRRPQEVMQDGPAIELGRIQRRQREEFGMPLHPEHIAGPAPPDRFDDAVGHAERLDDEILAEVRS